MKKISSLFLGIAIAFAGLSQAPPPIEDVLQSGNEASSTLFINHIHVNEKVSTTMLVGRSNEAWGTNSYLFGFGNTVGVFASNATIAGHGNVIGVGQSGSVFGKQNNVAGHAPSLLGYRNYMDEFSNKSIAVGRENYVYGASTIALGNKNTVDGTFSNSFGSFNEAAGNKVTSIGTYNHAYNEYSTAIGSYNYTNGVGSMAMGHSNHANANFSYAFGYGISNNIPSSVMIGTNNNAKLTVLNNGNVGIGAESPVSALEVRRPLNANSSIPMQKWNWTNDIANWGLSLNMFHSGTSIDYRFQQQVGSSLFDLLCFKGGNVLINKTSQNNTNYKLDVNGTARINKVVVNTTGADFVFDSSYRLAPLNEVEAFIMKHNHLPGIAPASEMQQEGMDMGDQQTKHLQKLEELTLYLIQQSKKMEAMQAEIEELKKQLSNKKRKSNSK